MATKGIKIGLLLPTKRNIHRPADPELAVRIAPIENSSRVKSPTNMPLGRRVTETRLDRVVVFPGITRIDQAGWICWIEFDVAAAQRLQMSITRGQFPSPVLLKETDRRDVLIVAGVPIPPIKRITIQPEPRPTEMLARKQFGFDGRRTQPRRKRYILVVGARQDCARTKRQGWNPSAIAVCFI